MKYTKPINLFQELMHKSALPKRRRLLGLDVGDKYVGLAVSDVNNKIASPLRYAPVILMYVAFLDQSSMAFAKRQLSLSGEHVLLRKKTNIDLMASDFQLLISELSLDGFVVGYPFSNHRSGSPDAVQVKLFIDDLCDTGKLEGLSYTYWNESYTSKNVEMLLKPLNLHPVQYKTVVDKFAAVGILQGYLDYVNCNERLKSFE